MFVLAVNFSYNRRIPPSDDLDSNDPATDQGTSNNSLDSLQPPVLNYRNATGGGAGRSQDVSHRIRGEKAFINYNGKELVIYKMQSGGIRYHSTDNPELKNLAVSSRSDFGKKLSPVLNEVFGADRPNMARQAYAIFDGLEITRGSPPPIERTPSTRNNRQTSSGVTVHNDRSASFKIGTSTIRVDKENRGVTVSINGSREDQLYFRDKNQLRVVMGGYLDHVIGTVRSGNRENVSNEVNEIYDRLNLVESVGRRISTDPLVAASTETILDLPVGEYQMNGSNPPATYLLVRNDNTGEYYCLSFVQESFDMIYGRGSARKAGLYSAPYAAELEFSPRNHSVSVEAYNSSRHSRLEKGTIVRFNSSQSHIGIAIGGNKVAHLDGGTLYVDWVGNYSGGWTPSEIVRPNSSSYVEKPMSPRNYDRVFVRGTNLETIGYRIKQAIPKLRSYNQAAIDETIFQLNKDLFKVNEGRAFLDTVAELERNTKVRVPQEWLR